MISFPNAKINIGLQIHEKRTDGYHNIASIFYPVAWADILEIHAYSTFHFESSGLEIPGSVEGNLVYKAFLLLKHLLPKDAGLWVHLHKIIPMGAGLGGGSADGAFALQEINKLYQLGLDIKDLQEYASKLGSDCPFFIQNRPRLCVETGTTFLETSLSLKGKWVLLVNPNLHISTAKAYSGVRPKKPEISLSEAVNRPIETWRETIINDFEHSLLPEFPVLQKLKADLYAKGALYASMTGSGSTFYGIFEEEPEHSGFHESFTTWKGKLE